MPITLLKRMRIRLSRQAKRQPALSAVLPEIIRIYGLFGIPLGPLLGMHITLRSGRVGVALVQLGQVQVLFSPRYYL